MPEPLILTEHLRDLEFKGLAVTTIRQRRYLMLRVSDHLDSLGLDLLSATEDSLASWSRTVAHRSDHGRRNAVTHCQSFYRWTLWAGHLSTDPSLRLIKPKYRAGIPRPIGRNDLAHALAEAPERVKPWLLLAVECGLRVSEIANLQRGDLLLDEEPPMLIVRGKGGKQRVVPLTPTVREALLRCPKRGPLFGRADGKPGGVNAALISQVGNTWLHETGISATMHQLRHRSATDLQREVGDIRITQAFLGHASPSTTAGYARVSDSTLNRAVLAVSARRSAALVPAT